MKPDDQVYPVEADTRLLLDAVLAEVRPEDRVLEVGTGSGVIAAALVTVSGVVATEINPHAAAAARQLGVEVIRTDLLAGIQVPFDLIVFNPPYLPTAPEERISDWLERALDGGPTGREVIARFFGEVGRVLAPGGRILLLISSLTGEAEVRELLETEGYSSEKIRSMVCEGEELMVLQIRRLPESSL
ncbi:MAG: class I SAM-dependent methyltransferase [Methanomicrobiales archaeon]|nr:class I SAM-dependent methyltransferase [Methanomicrobiales archaeon]